MAIIAKLNTKTKMIIRRDFLIDNFQGPFRTNVISDLLLAFAKKQMLDEFAAIERQYNDIYENCHKNLKSA